MSQETLLQIFLGMMCFEFLMKCISLGAVRYPRTVPAWSDALDVLVLFPFIVYTVLALT